MLKGTSRTQRLQAEAVIDLLANGAEEIRTGTSPETLRQTVEQAVTLAGDRGHPVAVVCDQLTARRVSARPEHAPSRTVVGWIGETPVYGLFWQLFPEPVVLIIELERQFAYCVGGASVEAMAASFAPTDAMPAERQRVWADIDSLETAEEIDARPAYRITPNFELRTGLAFLGCGRRFKVPLDSHPFWDGPDDRGSD